MGVVVNGAALVAVNGIQPTGSVDLTGDAAVGEVLDGKLFYSDDAEEQLEGTMPNNGDVSDEIETVAQEVTVPAGYTSGGTVAIAATEQAKVLAENIKSGVTLLGVEGTMVALARSTAKSSLTVPSDPTVSVTAVIQE